MAKAAKVTNLMGAVRSCLHSGRYLDTFHSSKRGKQRKITRPEILYVLRSGWHEKSKELYDDFHQAWNYAVRGKTVDGRELRIIVSFNNRVLLIITAIDLAK